MKHDVTFVRCLLAVFWLMLGAFGASAQDAVFGSPVIVPVPATAPSGVAYDAGRDRVFVTDTGGRQILHATLADVLAGTATWAAFGLVADRTDPAAMWTPQGLAVDADGHVYVADSARGQAFRFAHDAAADSYALDTGFVSATPLTVGGIRIDQPRDVAVGPAGAIFLMDSGNSRVLRAASGAASAWTVQSSDAGWGHVYGLHVDDAGAAYLTAPARNGVQVIAAPGDPATAIGRYGTDPRGLRFPRDTATLADGTLVIADTYNHRLNLMHRDGRPRALLGRPGLFHAPVALAVDGADRIMAIDAGYAQLVIWPGPGPRPFDLTVRDFIGDDGAEPSAAVDPAALSSPDILIRHAPIADLAALDPALLTALPFQQPRYDELNFIYVSVRNLGPQRSAPAQIGLYWADPGSALEFPADWSRDGFFRAWASPASNTPGHRLEIPQLDPGEARILGPLAFRPPAPEDAAAGDGRFDLIARVGSLEDPTYDNSGLMAVQASNNVARRGLLVQRGPFPIGPQDTLVITVDAPGGGTPADQLIVEQRMAEVGAWIEEVSWDTVSLNPVYRGPVDLTSPLASYSAPGSTLLVDMTREVIETLLAAEPDLMDQSPAQSEGDIDRVVIIVDDPAFFGNFATTGNFPFLIDGDVRFFSVSVQGPGNTRDQYAYGLAHQFGLLDLLEHPNADFARPYADGWDALAEPINGVHPVVWNKQHPRWADEGGRTVAYVPRPLGTATLSAERVALTHQSVAEEGDTVALVLGRTEGRTTFEAEDIALWVESRSNMLGDADSAVPGNGVIVYTANDLIQQGLGPVILRDHVPGTPDDLTDAAIPVGGAMTVPGTGIELRVGPALTEAEGGPGVWVEYDYDPPETDYDLWLAEGSPSWMSTSIWIDNQSDGYSEEMGIEPAFDPDTAAIEGEENRVYVRVENSGPADAYDVEVAFFFSSPYHTIDGEGAFDYFASAIIPVVPAGGSATVYVTWTPPVGEGEHHCVRVQLRGLTDDTNPSNNAAQRNLRVEESTTSSPYTPVAADFILRNSGESDKLVYLTMGGMPEDWTWSFSDEKVLMAPGEEYLGRVDIKPPDDAEVCTAQSMEITGWEPRGNTLVRLGGMTVRTDLRRTQGLTARTSVDKCPDRGQIDDNANNNDDNSNDERPRKRLWTAAGYTRDQLKLGVLPPWIASPRQCQVLTTTGCTDPVQANQEITLRYTDENGTPVYRKVMTDAAGCYEDFMVTAEGSFWTTDVTYGGTDCAGTATARTQVETDLPRATDQDRDGIKDVEEPQGDIDGDGIPNHLDADADGDGRIDGRDDDPFAAPVLTGFDGGDLPAWAFEPGQGQTIADALGRGPGLTLFAGPGRFVLRAPVETERTLPTAASAGKPPVQARSLGVTFAVLGGKPVRPQGRHALAGRIHYIKGSATVLDVPRYRTLTWADRWDGVDWHMGSLDGDLALAFALREGTARAVPEFEISGSGRIAVRRDGALEIPSRIGTLVLTPPELRAPFGSKAKARFEMIDTRRFALRIDNPGRDAIAVVTRFAGTGDRASRGLSNGNDVPGMGGDHAWTAAGALAEGEIVTGGSIAAVDAGAGDGLTGPMLDGFVYRLRADRSAVAAITVFGGKAQDAVTALAVHPRVPGVALAGWTVSDDLPVSGSQRAGAEDAVLGLLRRDGRGFDVLRYYGGKAADHAWAVALDGKGRIVIAGQTVSDQLPMGRIAPVARRGGGQDGFIARFAPGGGGAPDFASYIGGDGTEDALGLAVLRDGLLAVAGNATSRRIEITGRALALTGDGDGYLLILDPDAQEIRAAQIVGGAAPDRITALSLGPKGQIGLVGVTASETFLDAPELRRDDPGKEAGFALMLTDEGKIRSGAIFGGLERTVPLASGIDALDTHWAAGTALPWPDGGEGLTGFVIGLDGESGKTVDLVQDEPEEQSVFAVVLPGSVAAILAGGSAAALRGAAGELLPMRSLIRAQGVRAALRRLGQ